MYDFFLYIYSEIYWVTFSYQSLALFLWKKHKKCLWVCVSSDDSGSIVCCGFYWWTAPMVDRQTGHRHSRYDDNNDNVDLDKNKKPKTVVMSSSLAALDYILQIYLFAVICHYDRIPATLSTTYIHLLFCLWSVLEWLLLFFFCLLFLVSRGWRTFCSSFDEPVKVVVGVH